MLAAGAGLQRVTCINSWLQLTCTWLPESSKSILMLAMSAGLKVSRQGLKTSMSMDTNENLLLTVIAAWENQAVAAFHKGCWTWSQHAAPGLGNLGRLRFWWLWRVRLLEGECHARRVCLQLAALPLGQEGWGHCDQGVQAMPRCSQQCHRKRRQG